MLGRTGLDGVSSFDNLALGDTVIVSFSGNEASGGIATIQTEMTTFTIEASPPSTLFLSPDGNKLALNFGDGSGQVLDLEIYDVATGAMLDLSGFEDRLMETVTLMGCNPKRTQISVVFLRWVTNDIADVFTEDWTRTEPDYELEDPLDAATICYTSIYRPWLITVASR